MFFRWLHKGWKYFWGVILTICLILVILIGGVLIALQLDVTQDYLASRIEHTIEKRYNVDFSMGDIGGFLPFQAVLNDVVLMKPDSSNQDTLASVGRIETQIDIWGLAQNKISITGFSVDEPRIWVKPNEDGRLTFLEAKPAATSSSDTSPGNAWFTNVEVLAPSLQITNGRLEINAIPQKKQSVNLPQSLTFRAINASFFLEWNENQRYFDIESFSAKTNDLKMGHLTLSGQVYSDAQFLEFNSFYLNIGDSQFILNGEIDGLNIFKPNLNTQFLTSRYNLSIESNGIYPRQLNDLLPSAPDVEGPFTFELKTEGTTDSLYVDKASLGIGGSLVRLNGLFKNLRDRNNLSYQFRLDTVSLKKEDLQQFLDTLRTPPYQALENLSVSGRVKGTVDSADVDLGFKSPKGELTMKGQAQFKEPYKYTGSMSGKNLDISFLNTSKLDTTSINFDAQLNGYGLTLNEALSKFNATFYDSRINDVKIDQLVLTSSLVDGLWNQDYTYRSGKGLVEGTGWIDFSQKEPPVRFKGDAENINLAKFLGDSAVAATDLDFDYNVEIQGLDPDRLHGRANVDIKPSVIGGDSVRAHQMYMDLSSADEQRRTFRLTSSLFDMNITGQIVPRDIITQAKYWSRYLKNRLKSEILMSAPDDSMFVSIPKPQKNVVLDGSIKAKDLSLVKKYVPDFPSIYTDSKIIFNVNTNGSRLLLSAEMQADTLQYGALKMNDAHTKFMASFRSNGTLKDFSNLNLQTSVDSIRTERVDLDSVAINLSLNKDSVRYRQKIGSISKKARFNVQLNSTLSDTAIAVSVNEFFLGDDQYSWTSSKNPSFTFKRNGKVVFNNFNFQNRNEQFQLKGILSTNREDSLIYNVNDLNLERISDLIKGSINFAGILNGKVTTRSLTRQPTMEGELNISRFKLNDRTVGDVSFKSNYNQQKDRFDTQINVLTDSTKYGKYLDSNDQIGQNITLKGYVLTPDPKIKQDSLFYFDANLDEVDMWVVPLIIGNVFSEMEGRATGKGYIKGNFDDFDFHADFQTHHVFAKPQFIETNYFLNGHLVVDRNKGVVFDSINILDTKGGTGTLSGDIDLNDFNPITYFDLSLKMQGLQFLNNDLEPGIPFYGNVSGTGTIKLTGSNSNLYMHTENPIKVSSNSELSIPLLEETELSETGKFIRFVDSFENIQEKSLSDSTNPAGRQGLSRDQLKAAIQNLSFGERFNLDLQFDASNDVTVNLVFDPVTGEVLKANGSAQMRITLQDQDLQMFGNYKINGGTYQFVAGEIFSRKLDLQPGGTIVWEGAPDNAKLDISAVYEARPNIAPLTTGAASDPQNRNNRQIVPIELIVEINGTLQSVENNYYFTLPNTLDISNNSTLKYTLNQINRDENQKFLQAASILISGQFIPTQGVGQETATFGQNLGGASVINPLLSNQLLSPLLSNQINALINSDVSRLDVDFNLNAYNEVDLGLALRLYNDKLVLRREGQVTGGTQSSFGDRIGDLNATYRIRPGLSLTAFHRQDQVLNSLGATSSQAGDITPNVDGIGLEAQVQFNTWKVFPGKLKGIFVGTDKKEEKEIQTDSGTNDEAAIDTTNSVNEKAIKEN